MKVFSVDEKRLKQSSLSNTQETRDKMSYKLPVNGNSLKDEE